jgi:hypothetical protein
MEGFFHPNPQLIAGLTIGGNFSLVDSTPANGIARFDVQSGTWVALGAGLNGPAKAMAPIVTGVAHQDLYVGGQFTLAGGAPASNIARWTGAAWQSLPAGNQPNNGVAGEVRALKMYNGSLFVGGNFLTAGGAFLPNLARWDGAAWQSASGGADGAVNAMLISNNQLIVAGEFQHVGGVACSYIAAWNGSAFTPLGAGLNGPVRALAVSGSSIIAGGSFTQAGGAPALHVAEWNGAAWLPISATQAYPGGGVDGDVYGVCVTTAGDIVVGGSFANAANTFSPFVARASRPTPLVFYDQPSPAHSCLGGSAQFSTTVSHGAPQETVVYQWYLDGSLLADGPRPDGALVAGATTRNLNLSNLTAAETGGVSVRATSSCGEMVQSTAAMLTVAGSCAACGTADFNGDGDLGTDADIGAFFACLAGSCCPTCWGADFNGDGDIGTDADIESFFRVLGGGTC